jgi:hypothetical protein
MFTHYPGQLALVCGNGLPVRSGMAFILRVFQLNQ